MIPGEFITGDAVIEINADSPVTTLSVANTGDRPIQVGSHYPLFRNQQCFGL